MWFSPGPKSVISSSTQQVDPSSLPKSRGDAAEENAFASIALTGDPGGDSPLLRLGLGDLCDALNYLDPGAVKAIRDKTLATLLLYRVAHNTDDADAVQRLLDAGACPRGGMGPDGRPGYLYREYAWRYRMDDAARSAVRRAAGGMQLTTRQRELLLEGCEVATLHHVRVHLLERSGGRDEDEDSAAEEGGGSSGEAATWRSLRRQAPEEHPCDARLELACEPILEPLHLASGSGRAQACKALLLAGAAAHVPAWRDEQWVGADPIRENDGALWPLYDTPVARAAYFRQGAAVSVLLQHLGKAAAAGDVVAPQPSNVNLVSAPLLPGRLLALLLRCCVGGSPSMFQQLLPLALPKDDPDSWLAVCGDAREEDPALGQMLQQVLVYEAGGFTPYRRVLLMAQAACDGGQRLLDPFLDHVALGPSGRSALRRSPALGLALINAALCQHGGGAGGGTRRGRCQPPLMLRSLLAAGVDEGPATRDLVGVPLLPAALRAEASPAVVAELLAWGAAEHCTAATCASRGAAPMDEEELSDPRLADAWQERCWLTYCPPMDVALTVLKRAMRAELAAGTPGFCVDAAGHCPSRAARLLGNVEALAAAGLAPAGEGDSGSDGGGKGGAESAAGLVNEMFPLLVESWREARRSAGQHGGLAASPQHGDTNDMGGRLAKMMAWARARMRSSADGGSQAGDGGVAGGAAAPGTPVGAGSPLASSGYSTELSLARSADISSCDVEDWHLGAARYLRLLLVAGERMQWTPALHLLWPQPFKAAVRQLLLASCHAKAHDGATTEGLPLATAAAGSQQQQAAAVAEELDGHEQQKEEVPAPDTPGGGSSPQQQLHGGDSAATPISTSGGASKQTKRPPSAAADITASGCSAPAAVSTSIAVSTCMQQAPDSPCTPSPTRLAAGSSRPQEEAGAAAQGAGPAASPSLHSLPPPVVHAVVQRMAFPISSWLREMQ